MLRADSTATRALHLPVILIDRPSIPPRPTVGTVAQALQWLGLPDVHDAAERGV